MSNSKPVIPKHVAIIMDGNGRWATSKNLSRTEGHKKGSLAIENLLEIALDLELKNVSLYAFSTENWKRPITEINSLFNLLINFIDKKLDFIIKNKIRIIQSGSKRRLNKKVISKIEEAINKTKKNKILTVNFCFNYGSKEEILQASQRLFLDRLKHKTPLTKELKEKEFEKFLYTALLPPVDLLIRTAGEKRLSNFLLWQSAYAELYFTDVLWPDFGKDELMKALDWYQTRIRKFGKVV